MIITNHNNDHNSDNRHNNSAAGTGSAGGSTPSRLLLLRGEFPPMKDKKACKGVADVYFDIETNTQSLQTLQGVLFQC